MPDQAAGRAATVEFEHVTKRYERRQPKDGAPGAVNDLSLAVPAGKICVLVGPSGCGKTTSLKMVNRLIEPTSGRILHRRHRRRRPRRDRAAAGHRLRHPAGRPLPAPDRSPRTWPPCRGCSAGRAPRAARARARSCSSSSGLDPATYRARYPIAALGRRAPARRRRPGARRRPADHAHGRALRRRRPDRPRAPPGRVPAPPGDARARRSCSSPTTSTRRSRWATSSPSCRRAACWPSSGRRPRSWPARRRRSSPASSAATGASSASACAAWTTSSSCRP